MTLKKLLSDTAQFVLIPGRFWKEGTGWGYKKTEYKKLAARNRDLGKASTLYAALAIAGAGVYANQGCTSGEWTLSGQSQVRQERAADREELRSLMDPNGDGVSLQELYDFTERMGNDPAETPYHRIPNVNQMDPEEVKTIIRKCKGLEQ